ncbi:uncharacterized protein CBL_08141 [Carabus blaptoides fortunei]
MKLQISVLLCLVIALSIASDEHRPKAKVKDDKEPEPIIEIIIKESNVTLPPVPVPTLPPKKREPVQVFYVKYKKNPNGQGKHSVVYDKPVPALTPIKAEDHEEAQADQPHHQEYVTLSPPPSTTLRTIIRPDSETYIGTSGIHVTFGSEHKKHEKSIEGLEESAPQPAITGEEKKKDNKLPPNIVLPDEVPDDLREQLLSSGILSNADISVLDYDKVGDIPIDALPPDQLANFYGAGGAQQISASERKISVVKPDGDAVEYTDNKENFDQELVAEGSEIDEVQIAPQTQAKVDMKVVHYDSDTKQGQAVQESYVREDATHVDPVVLNDNKYNRYLPLKVSGAQFPIPDVPELQGRNITSVVVLAPVDYEFHPHHSERNTRDIEGDIKDVRFLAGEALKQLIKEPTAENYKKWLDKENQTVSDKQSVVLLVTGSSNGNKDDKEIFMYDVASKTVSKLSGELSSAFVEAAESNVNEDDIELLPDASEIIETRISSDLDDSASNIIERFVDISNNDDLSLSASNSENIILVSSGYSKTG